MEEAWELGYDDNGTRLSVTYIVQNYLRVTLSTGSYGLPSLTHP